MTKIPELTSQAFAAALPRRQRERLMRGKIESGADVVALRRFVGLTQSDFARALGISVHTLRNWEQGRRRPTGPAFVLLKIAEHNPRAIEEALHSRAPPPAAATDRRAAAVKSLTAELRQLGQHRLAMRERGLFDE